jgi:large subunit ribosomal protein L17
MNNKTGFNRLNRRAGHRRALIKNMVTSLFTYERITTTRSKALEVRRHAEKMVTRAKVDSVHNRREIAKTITQDDVLTKLFTVLGPRFEKRAGGYTRILKLGQRFGDAAQMVILEFVERTEKVDESAAATAAATKAPKDKSAPQKASGKKSGEVSAEKVSKKSSQKKSAEKVAAE